MDFLDAAAAEEGEEGVGPFVSEDVEIDEDFSSAEKEKDEGHEGAEGEEEEFRGAPEGAVESGFGEADEESFGGDPAEGDEEDADGEFDPSDGYGFGDGEESGDADEAEFIPDIGGAGVPFSGAAIAWGRDGAGCGDGQLVSFAFFGFWFGAGSPFCGHTRDVRTRRGRMMQTDHRDER